MSSATCVIETLSQQQYDPGRLDDILTGIMHQQRLMEAFLKQFSGSCAARKTCRAAHILTATPVKGAEVSEADQGVNAWSACGYS